VEDPRIAAATDRRRALEARRRTLVRRTRLWTLVIGVGLLVAGAGLGVVALVATAAANLATGLGVLIAAAVVGVSGVALLAVGVALRRPEHLRETGLPGTGVFVGIQEGMGLSMSSSDGTTAGRWALRFLVEVPGRAPCEVVVRDVVPIGSIPRLVPGTAFPVFVDPKRPTRVLVDWPET
jgi:hypothetical protein